MTYLVRSNSGWNRVPVDQHVPSKGSVWDAADLAASRHAKHDWEM